MKEDAVEKNFPAPVRDKGQYALVFSAITLMLYASGFPIFLLFFVSVLAFFIWKVFSSESRNETRRIFEFYLSANEILREDDRRWYGFEILETIRQGENILQALSAAPPLVHFALGALYQKVNDHGAALKHLSPIADERSTDESAIVFPTKELLAYVQMLRKIERTPAEAPLTSAAVRSLERARKNKANQLLEYSRSNLANAEPQPSPAERKDDSAMDLPSYRENRDPDQPTPAIFHQKGDIPKQKSLRFARSVVQRTEKRKSSTPDRKSISEVLHEVYDKNSQ